MAKKLALGKGISSLIQGTAGQVALDTYKNEFANSNSSIANRIDARDAGPSQNIATIKNDGPLMVAITQIKTNPNQPRKIFKEKELEELGQSIKENGIIQPLIVIQKDKHFELIAGERRLRAAKRAGLEQVPVVLKRATDRDKMVMSIIENVQRSDLNCVEEALAYYQLMEEFKLTQEEVAQKIGKERSTVANFLRILKLPREIIDFLQKEDLSFGHGKVLAAIPEREKAIRCAREAVAQKLSVRELEGFIKTKNQTPKEKSQNNFLNDKMEGIREQLERATGFHFDIKSKKQGMGQIVLKFSNEAEFNDIFEYLMKK